MKYLIILCIFLSACSNSKNGVLTICDSNNTCQDIVDTPGAPTPSPSDDPAEIDFDLIRNKIYPTTNGSINFLGRLHIELGQNENVIGMYTFDFPKVVTRSEPSPGQYIIRVRNVVSDNEISNPICVLSLKPNASPTEIFLHHNYLLSRNLNLNIKTYFVYDLNSCTYLNEITLGQKFPDIKYVLYSPDQNSSIISGLSYFEALLQNPSTYNYNLPSISYGKTINWSDLKSMTKFDSQLFAVIGTSLWHFRTLSYTSDWVDIPQELNCFQGNTFIYTHDNQNHYLLCKRNNVTPDHNSYYLYEINLRDF